jgi:hypothetical protein
MGCVMARTLETGAQIGDDLNDRTPTQAAFQPFLYASTYHAYPYTTSSGTHYYVGDNDWTATNIRQPALGDSDVGPNLDCPTAPILPETVSKATVAAAINNLVPAYRGGTFINLGLQAGWWTLSPIWQGVWGDPNMPLAYNTPNMKKVIVLMTDGNNNWNDWTGGVPGVGKDDSNNTVNYDGDKDYTAYGRLRSNTRGLSTTDPTTTLNMWMSQMCTAIKQNGITIYTILFNNNTAATQTLFRNLRLRPQQLLPEPHRHRSAECLQADRPRAVRVAAIAIIHRAGSYPSSNAGVLSGIPQPVTSWVPVAVLISMRPRSPSTSQPGLRWRP